MIIKQQSGLSQYKSTKSGKSQTNTDKIKGANNSTHTGNNDYSKTEWKKGQIVHGKVIDLRYNKVTIQLEPGKQVVTGKLSGDLPLAIGQDATFLVTEDSSERLTLKYIPSETATSTNITIEKALTASNLPKTERNKEIVEQLLNHRMSIDKQTLQTLAKSSHNNQEASPLTLVLMSKNNIPMTSANIMKFEAYQKGTHQILNDINTITEQLTDTLYQDTQSSNEMKAFSQQLLSIVTSSNDRSPVMTSSKIPINNIIIQEDLILLHSTLLQQTKNNSFALSTIQLSTLDSIANGTAGLNETLELIKTLFPLEADSQQELKTLEVTESPKVNIIPNKEKTSQHIWKELESSRLQGKNEIAPIIDKLMNHFTFIKNEVKLLSVLSPQERTNLSEMLHSFADVGETKNQLQGGTASLSDLLTMIKEGLPYQEDSVTRTLLQSQEYSKILREVFHQKWTITPEKLTENNSINKLYQNLHEDMKRISELVNSSHETITTTNFHDSVQNLQENLQFMKDLNEVFTYVQLPLQLKDQDIHSELFVFTKKKALQDKQENLNILLHLDMVNLGSINIYIQMNHTQIQARFYIEDKGAEQIVSEHLPLLENALQAKGYNLNAEISAAYEKPDFSRDFIEQSSLESSVQRYTFDIRT